MSIEVSWTLEHNAAETLLSLPFCVCWLGSQTNLLHEAAGKVCFYFSQHHFLQDELNLISDLRVHNPSEGL